MDIPEALKRVKEHTKCYRDLPSHYTAGLDLLNGINLEHFKDPKQKAELFLMKAEFQSKLGFTEEANQSYGTAIALHDTFGKGKVTLLWQQNTVQNQSI
jgi:transformation/transcription domain-associated protein